MLEKIFYIFLYCVACVIFYGLLTFVPIKIVVSLIAGIIFMGWFFNKFDKDVKFFKRRK